jgi:hypothetical protein
MNKKRKLALILTSPIMLCLIIAIAFVSVLMYAMYGKWEFKDGIKEIFGDEFINSVNKFTRRIHAKSKN